MSSLDDRFQQLSPDNPFAWVTPVSNFGGPDDQEDNGKFKWGGGSIQEDGSINPEPYAAFPDELYSNGIVKPGQRIKVTNPKTGKSLMVVARDSGPSAKNRGLDLAPHAMDELGLDTDSPAVVDFDPSHDTEENQDPNVATSTSNYPNVPQLDPEQLGTPTLGDNGSVVYSNGVTVHPDTGLIEMKAGDSRIVYDGNTGKKIDVQREDDPFKTFQKKAAEKGIFLEDYGDKKEFVSAAQQAIKSGGEDADVDAIAEGIKNGDQPPTLQGLYRYGKAVRGKLARDGFSLAQATQDWQATTRNMATLNGPQQTRLRQATQFSYDSLDIIDDLNKKWQAGNYPLINKARLIAASQGALGPEAQEIATNLLSQINDLTGELATVYQGGNSPTDHGMALAAKNLQADFPEHVLDSQINLVRKNLQIRLNSLKNTGVAGASSDNPYAPKTAATPTPEATDEGPVMYSKKTNTYWKKINGVLTRVNEDGSSVDPIASH